MTTAAEARPGELSSHTPDLRHWRFGSVEGLAPRDVKSLERLVADDLAFGALPTISESDASHVARATLSCGPVILKRYRFASALYLRTFLRRSLAEREARAMTFVAQALPANPIRVLAWAERRRFGCVSSAVIVTSEFTESCDLRQLKHCEPGKLSRRVAMILDALPALVAKLHRGGVFARALRGKNVLLQTATGDIALIDCPRASRPRRMLARHRAYDLATLSLELRRFMSDAEWNAFLGAYFRASGLSADASALLAPERIHKLAERIAHRSPVASMVRSTKRRLRHTRIGRWILGRRSSMREDQSHAQ